MKQIIILLALTMLFLSYPNVIADEKKDVSVEKPPTHATTNKMIEWVSIRRGVVTIRLQDGSDATEYCFQYSGTFPKNDSFDWQPINSNEFQVFKFDGEYDLYVRNSSGKISTARTVKVDSGYHYTIDGVDQEGVRMRFLRMSLGAFLEQKGSSIERFNQTMLDAVWDAGVYTREGVAAAALCGVSMLADYGASVPYYAGGMYQGEDDWGFSPDWGYRHDEPSFNSSAPNKLYYNHGLQCVGACVWAYKQAGLNLYNANIGWRIGRCGEVRYDYDNQIDYRKMKTADLMCVGEHYRMVLDRLDTDGDGECDAYLTFEMHAPDMTCRIIPMQNIRYVERFDMSAVFQDTGKWRKFAMFYPGTYLFNDLDYGSVTDLAAEESPETYQMVNERVFVSVD